MVACAITESADVIFIKYAPAGIVPRFNKIFWLYCEVTLLTSLPLRSVINMFIAEPLK